MQVEKPRLYGDRQSANWWVRDAGTGQLWWFSTRKMAYDAAVYRMTQERQRIGEITWGPSAVLVWDSRKEPQVERTLQVDSSRGVIR